MESSSTTAAKRQFLRDGWGEDIRLQVVALMRQVWSELGPLQLELSAGIVGPLLQLGTSACEGIASMGADFYFDLTKHEFAATRGFRKIEHETVSDAGAAQSRFPPPCFVVARTRWRPIAALICTCCPHVRSR